MCGIIGRVGSDNAVPYLLEGLKRLEYRGYDSAGIAFLNNGDISSLKALGKLHNLCRKVNPDTNFGFIGIGHTRWATHGAPSVKNAHPHISPDGKFAVVHNGIIENSDELKAKELQGCIFSSETDTEVVAHLLEKYYEGNVVQAISVVQKLLAGSYALGILCTDFPDTLFCAAKASPLIAAKGRDGGFIASDVSAVTGFADEYYTVSDGQICGLSRDGIRLFDCDAVQITKPTKPVKADGAIGDKQGYEHYMMLEMMQQPDAVRNTLHPLMQNGKVSLQNMLPDDEFFKNPFLNIAIVACGSAYHTGLAGKRLFEYLGRVPCRTEIASEFRYSNPLINKQTLAVFISQSGETADTLAALRLSKQTGAKVLSIVNVKESAIANESDYVIFTNAGRETAVATTKAYSAQLAVLYALVLYICKVRNSVSDEKIAYLTNELIRLPERIEETILNTKPIARQLAGQLKTADDMYFIGRQLDFAAATEGSLKYKEISYVHSEAYAAGELKHGTISLIEEGTPVIAVATDDSVLAKTVSNIREVESRGAKTVMVTFERYKSYAGNAETIIIPETAAEFSVSLSVIPLQLLSYYTAKLRGCDIDKPKNLAKSVTVE